MTLSRQLQEGRDLLFYELYERVLDQVMKPELKDAGYQIFLRYGRNLASGDLHFHRAQEIHCTGELAQLISQEKARYKELKKISYVLGVSGSLLFIIVLL